MVSSAYAAMTFDFGGGPAPVGGVSVAEPVVYSKERGHGFEPGGSVFMFSDGGAGGFTSEGSCFFSVAVPEGNHRVTLTLGHPTRPSTTTVKAELRRLMIENESVEAGATVDRSFIVNVRTPRLEAGGEVRLKDRERESEAWAWDGRLTLEFSGEFPAVRRIVIDPVDVPTVYILGDSTVCDQPSEPYASWGQMLTRFLDDGVAVANHGESGETYAASIGRGRLHKVEELMRPGDYLMLQFGHNDMKQRGDGKGPFENYTEEMRQHVEAARAKRATPILITSMHRQRFDEEGRVVNTLGDYPEAVRRLAAELDVALIDLHEMSAGLYDAFGPEGSNVLFKYGDGTHHNNFGAYQLAKCVAEGIRRSGLSLARHLVTDFDGFDPAHPDDPAAFEVPASGTATGRKPDGD